MAYTRAADGITKQGKTNGKNFGESGPTCAPEKGGKGSKGGKTDAEMLAVGRNAAKIANQKRG